MSGVNFVSMPEMGVLSKSRIEKAAQRTLSKLQTIINNEVDLKVRFKQRHEAGKREKHIVHLHLTAPGISLLSTAADWQIVTALQKALKTLEKEALKSLKQRH